MGVIPTPLINGTGNTYLTLFLSYFIYNSPIFILRANEINMTESSHSRLLCE